MAPTIDELRAEAADYQDALDWASTAILLERHRAAAREDYGLCCEAGWSLRQLGRLTEARDWLEHAAGIEPASHLAYYFIGVVYYDLEEYGRAMKALQHSLALREGYLPRNTLALVLQAVGRNAEAERMHRANLEQKPESPERHASLAHFLRDAGREPEALEVYRRAEALHRERIAASGGDARMLGKYAEFLRMAGRDRSADAWDVRAEEAYADAVLRNPRDWRTRRRFARYLFKRGRVIEARDYDRQARELRRLWVPHG